VHSPFDLLALLLVLSAGLAYLNCRFMKLPMTVGLLVGAAAGTLILIALDALLPGLGLKPALRDLISRIDFPAALLDGFLAFPLFAGALQVNSADLFGAKMDDPGVGDPGDGSVGRLTAAAMFAASRWLGLGVSFPWCRVFGALISPTDPVSVLDVLKRIGIPRGLQATVAGESLFNDGIGVVQFTLALSLATGDPIDRFGPATIASLFLLQAVGGGLLGLGFGYLTLLLVRPVDDYNVELIISLALASGTYSAAGLLGVSGPIAVVVAGIIIGSQGMDRAKTSVIGLPISQDRITSSGATTRATSIADPMQMLITSPIRSCPANHTAENRSAIVPISASTMTPRNLDERRSVLAASDSASEISSLSSAAAAVAPPDTARHSQGAHAAVVSSASPVENTSRCVTSV
jgi:hypothetical protein